MSDTYYGLSKMEYNLMKYFWNTNAPVSFSEVENIVIRNYIMVGLNQLYTLI